jgi:hypothetical protein
MKNSAETLLIRSCSNKTLFVIQKASWLVKGESSQKRKENWEHLFYVMPNGTKGKNRNRISQCMRSRFSFLGLRQDLRKALQVLCCTTRADIPVVLGKVLR